MCIVTLGIASFILWGGGESADVVLKVIGDRLMCV